MDAETKQAIKRLAVAIDSIAGMAAGCAAYVAALEGAAFADRRKAVGISRTLVPEGLSGDVATSPALVAQAMIDQIGSMARQLQALKARADQAPRASVDHDRGAPPWEPDAALRRKA